MILCCVHPRQATKQNKKVLFSVIDAGCQDIGYGALYAVFASPRLAREAGPTVDVVAIGDFKGSGLVDQLVQDWKKSGLARQIYRIWQFLKDLLTSRQAVEAAA